MSEPEPVESYREEIDAAERKIAGEIDPGFTAVVIAAVVVLLGLSLALPHAGAVSGLHILGNAAVLADESIALPSRVFVWFAAVFGLGFSVLTLLTRRWALAFVSAAGCTVGTVFGFLSIWSRQTLAVGDPGAGPGAGLLVGLLCMGVLVLLWLRVVWTHSALDAMRRANGSS